MHGWNLNVMVMIPWTAVDFIRMCIGVPMGSKISSRSGALGQQATDGFLLVELKSLLIVFSRGMREDLAYHWSTAVRNRSVHFTSRLIFGTNIVISTTRDQEQLVLKEVEIYLSLQPREMTCSQYSYGIESLIPFYMKS